MQERTYHDVPQHLRNKYVPKLTKLFNKGAKLAEKMLNNESDDLSFEDLNMFDKAKLAGLVTQFTLIAKSLESNVGNEDDIGLILEEALQNSDIKHLAEKLDLNF